jgi:RNA polymerase sigma factor for flagellar operon FliA
MYNASGQLNKTLLVEQFAPLVKRIAYHLMARLPASVQVDDLIQNGMMGLLEAAGRFDNDFGAQFETYAGQRIRGAMLDGLRENDWMPRQLRKDMRRVEVMINKLEQSSGKPPNERELAEALGMELSEYQRVLTEAKGHQLVYLEDIVVEDGGDFLERHVVAEADGNPLTQIESEDTKRALVAAIDTLPEREKMVMALYYEQELNLREIGEVLGVTESRVCQLHSQAIARVRAKMMGTSPAKTATQPAAHR